MNNGVHGLRIIRVDYQIITIEFSHRYICVMLLLFQIVIITKLRSMYIIAQYLRIVIAYSNRTTALI